MPVITGLLGAFTGGGPFGGGSGIFTIPGLTGPPTSQTPPGSPGQPPVYPGGTQVITPIPPAGPNQITTGPFGLVTSAGPFAALQLAGLALQPFVPFGSLTVPAANWALGLAGSALTPAPPGNPPQTQPQPAIVVGGPMEATTPHHGWGPRQLTGMGGPGGPGR
jgi:hypothetical protein